jgi:hypothetical protein
LIIIYLLFHFLVLIFGQARVEWISFERATASDTSRDNVLGFGIDIDVRVQVTEIASGMLIGFLESHVVFFNDGIEQISEHGVRIGIGRVDTDTGVQISNAWKTSSKYEGVIMGGLNN